MRRVGRYRVDEPIAFGGMASVHLARLEAELGFRRIVAVKAMHVHLAKDPEFRAMFLDEARTVARIRHANVVATLDILAEADDILLVMDYVHGPSLAAVLAATREAPIPLPIAAKLTLDVLEGLHAAHDARDDDGKPLAVVHRDVSPHNVLVGDDGVARVMDFGIAIAADRSRMTKAGEVKGKIVYMAPEQARGEEVDARADVYAVGSAFFELLTRRTPFDGTYSETMFRLLSEPPMIPSALRGDVPPELDAIILCALSKDKEERFPSARVMADSLRGTATLASAQDVAAWVVATMPDFFRERDERIARFVAAPVAGVASSGTPVVASSSDVPATLVPDEAVVPTAAPVAVREGPTRRWHGAVFVALAGAILALGAVIVARSPTTARQTQVEAASTSATDTVSSSALKALPLMAPATPAPSAEPPTAVSPSPPAVASGAPHPGPDPRVGARSGSTHGTRSVSPLAQSAVTAPSSSPSPPPAGERPMCCVEVTGKWHRLSVRPDCVDNCPAGTP